LFQNGENGSVKNDQVVSIFRNLANLLEVGRESLFRIRAYRRAAQLIETLPEPIEEIERRTGLTALSGIGKDLAGKIREILETGSLSLYEEMKMKTPPVLLDFLSLPGLQPLIARYLFERLEIRSLEDLEQLVCTHMLRNLPEFNKEMEEKLLAGIRTLKANRGKDELPI
jgi:DNA polymerase (family X)